MGSRVVQSSVRLASALGRGLGGGGGGVAVARGGGGTDRRRGLASEAAQQRRDSEKRVGSGDIRVDLLNPFELHRLHDGPATDVFTSKEELMQMYMDMTVLRRMELAADMLFKSQQIRGFCHLYDGQEAISVGMEAALTYEDSVLTAYRDHGIFLGRGGTTFEAFSELMGKKTGCAIGKGGSMHLYKRENNYYGGWGIVGTSGPLGTGLAFALKYQKKPNVAVAIYGDGAANQGQLYEAQNCAALWDLPVIYLVENNHYGMGTAEWRASKKATFFDRLSYIPGIKVDGMDAFSVKAAMLFAKEHCVAGKGPIVVECDTYRYHGHSMSDPGSTYRSRDEVQGFRKERDPIERIRNIILKEELSTAEELKKLDKQVRREVEEEAAKAREAPQPEEHELFSNIYRLDTGLVTYGCDRKDTIKLP
ncbi:pyruvate dehydrogenase E1 component subunit alpha [Marchantia polymorpha subsp. ruderalis]|uniref:Pyruvate dehydrogenase E1 component subunit alpha n=2 Tax=Marchantia polymorpha TaxID=3197 RepID=A0A176VWN1_MARPO|nr:hypothetical protein AXG93_48s1090 [Marchantia polymorpha subsp. ruderalis]PTQ41118.1 hypothetical protein MARPO_0036s0100 [Marchantia polymorpha]BBM97815.1 hypothetical protein Mp_1g08570 [Marchantia polymorpha subsp. ruderalis]|eukprot:PTQ41118.1 hypothetical protein MARPO_0036s0100 [Marchantia polymorpha]